MSVITVAQRKGGAGKTTLAAHLAASMAATRRVALIDIDPQRTLTRWHSLRAGRQSAAAIAVLDVSGWRLPREIERLRSEVDVIVIDSPPSADTDARIAVRAADLVLIPVQPSHPDLWAAEDTLRLASDEHRSARLVLNRASGAAKLRQDVERQISGHGYHRLEASLGNRVGFAASFAQGLGVTEAAPRSVAAREVQSLQQEIEKMIG